MRDNHNTQASTKAVILVSNGIIPINNNWHLVHRSEAPQEALGSAHCPSMCPRYVSASHLIVHMDMRWTQIDTAIPLAPIRSRRPPHHPPLPEGGG